VQGDLDGDQQSWLDALKHIIRYSVRWFQWTCTTTVRRWNITQGPILQNFLRIFVKSS